MNADELLMETIEIPSKTNCMIKKERLYSLAVSGKTQQYLGKEMTREQIQKLSLEDVETYYNRYESKLGSRMIQSLGHTLINLYVKVFSSFAPIDSEQDLKYDLERDPLLTKGLESVGCELYYRFGGLLAPLSMGLITFSHIHFPDNKNEQSGDEGSNIEGTERSNIEGTERSNIEGD